MPSSTHKASKQAVNQSKEALMVAKKSKVVNVSHILVDISAKITGEWKIIPKRGVVECNFAWLNNRF